MVDCEIKKTLPHQEVSHTAENLGMVSLAELREEDADGLHAFALQRTGDHARLVVKLFGCGFDALPSCLWNRTPGRIIQDIRDGGWAEAQVLGQRLEARTSRDI